MLSGAALHGGSDGLSVRGRECVELRGGNLCLGWQCRMGELGRNPVRLHKALVSDARVWGPIVNGVDGGGGSDGLLGSALPAAAVNPMTPYAMRHGFASLLIAEGRSVVEVAQQLGHSPEEEPAPENGDEATSDSDE